MSLEGCLGSEGAAEGTKEAGDSPKDFLVTTCGDCEPVSKTGVPLRGTVGSNPTSSANSNDLRQRGRIRPCG